MTAVTSIMTQFDRVLGQPLETNTVFNTYDSARDYAANNAQAYAGQILRVLSENGVNVYVIETNKTLSKLGSYYGEYIANASPTVIFHNLGRCPHVLFVDENGNKCEVEVHYPDLNQVKVIWNNNITGKIYLL